MVPARASGDVGVLPQFDVALGAENEKPPIAPCAQPIGSKPVDANVAEAAVAVQHHVAEILELRVVRVIHVRHLRRNHLGRGGSGVVNELVGLVRPDVA